MLVTKLLLGYQRVWNTSKYHCLVSSVLVATTVLPPCIKCVCNWLVIFNSCLSILNFRSENVNPVFIYSLYVIKQMRCKIITNNNHIWVLHFCSIPDGTIHVRFKNVFTQLLNTVVLVMLLWCYVSPLDLCLLLVWRQENMFLSVSLKD